MYQRMFRADANQQNSWTNERLDSNKIIFLAFHCLSMNGYGWVHCDFDFRLFVLEETQVSWLILLFLHDIKRTLDMLRKSKTPEAKLHRWHICHLVSSRLRTMIPTCLEDICHTLFQSCFHDNCYMIGNDSRRSNNHEDIEENELIGSFCNPRNWVWLSMFLQYIVHH